MQIATPDLLTAEREAELGRLIELGVLARHALAHPWATDATTAELRRIAAEGDRARDEFLLANLRLVGLLARRAMRRCGLEFDELFQEGCLALGRALQRFDYTRGRFTTIAFPAVSQHLVRVTCSLAGGLGLPDGRAVAHRRALRVAEELGQGLGRTAELAEVSAALGRDRDWTARLLAHRPPIPLDALDHQLPVNRAAACPWEHEQFAASIDRELHRLPPDESAAVALRFGFADGQEHSYREIATRLGISAASARRSAQRGLATLRARRTNLDGWREAG